MRTEVCKSTRNWKRQPTHPEWYGDTTDLYIPAEYNPKEMHDCHRQEQCGGNACVGLPTQCAASAIITRRTRNIFGGAGHARLTSPLLRDDCCSHRRLRAIDWRLMQHGEEPPLRIPLDRRGLAIGASLYTLKLGHYQLLTYDASSMI
jgi:hypothetical protein